MNRTASLNIGNIHVIILFYSPSHVATQFALIATEPDTVVDITFPPEVVGKPWADGHIQVRPFNI